MQQTINEYATFRGYKRPQLVDAMLFLASEVGELVEASMDGLVVPQDLLSEVEELLGKMPPEALKAMGLGLIASSGKICDMILSGDSEWVRNNDRVKEPNVPDEVADVLMMLYEVSRNLKIDPVIAMAQKMRKKGFMAPSSWYLISQVEKIARGYALREEWPAGQFIRMDDNHVLSFSDNPSRAIAVLNENSILCFFDAKELGWV